MNLLAFLLKGFNPVLQFWPAFYYLCILLKDAIDTQAVFLLSFMLQTKLLLLFNWNYCVAVSLLVYSAAAYNNIIFNVKIIR